MNQIIGEIIKQELNVQPPIQQQAQAALPIIAVPCVSTVNQTTINERLKAVFGNLFASAFGVKLKNRTRRKGDIALRKCNWYIYFLRNAPFDDTRGTETFIRSLLRRNFHHQMCRIKEYEPFALTTDGRNAIMVRMEVANCPGNHTHEGFQKTRQHPARGDSGDPNIVLERQSSYIEE